MWRTFDVGAVVESLALDGAIVVAGAGGMRRRVGRARVAETPDQLRAVGGGDVIVATADLLLAPGASWDDTIRSLDASDAAALTVRCDDEGQVLEALIAAADRCGFPVIAFPSSTLAADMTTAVVDALLDAQGRRLERFLDIHQRFTPVMLAGGGSSEIATTLHELIGHPVAILDDVEHIVVIEPEVFDVGLARLAGVSHPILAADHLYGEILVATGGALLDDEQRLALERASTALALRFAHASAVAADNERFATTTLEELIAGHRRGAGDVAERAMSFGWDLSVPRAVLLASVDPPTDGATLQQALATIAAAARATLGASAIVWTRSTSVAALLAPRSARSNERRLLAEALRRELDRRLQTVTVSIGVGRRVDTPVALSHSYLDATRAVEVGRWAKERHVTEVYDELGLERLLASTPDDDLAEFVAQTIGVLIDHDRAHRTDLVETLGVWLDTRNMAEAARRTNVHYNTLKNRLDRVESLLGPVTTDAAKSLDCAVAIHVARHYDGAWSLHESSRSTDR